MNKLIIDGMEYSLTKSTSILHHFNTPMVQYQGNTYYGLATGFQLEKAEQSNGWVSVKDRLPEEGGRYWCYVEEFDDLGVGHFQWNCSYNENEKTFSDRYLNGGKVTHWMPLPAAPEKAPAPEKNYEILEGVYENYPPHKWDEKGNKDMNPCPEQGCKIYSIKRLSDGEVFKLGDTICSLQGNTPYIIERISVCNEGNARLWVTDGHSLGLHNAVKKLPPVPLFKTEDGVELFDGDECWCVSVVSNYSINKVSARPEIFPAPSYFKYFSGKNNAINFAAKHARLLSYLEIEQVLSNEDRTVVRQVLKDKIILACKL